MHTHHAAFYSCFFLVTYQLTTLFDDMRALASAAGRAAGLGTPSMQASDSALRRTASPPPYVRLRSIVTTSDED
jgi:hypothetical protein